MTKFKKLCQAMIVKQMFFPTVKKMFLAAAAVVTFMQCSEEEIAPATPSSETVIAATSVNTLPTVTVTGTNTIYATATDCKTCTYIIPAGSSVVDGKALNLQPCSVICINSVFRYDNLEIVNVEGTDKNPITITTVSANPVKSSSVQDVTTEVNSVDPY